MNETIKTIYERRAVRKYKDIPVKQEAINQLIEAGLMAPSAMNRQPWKFYVVTDKEKICLFSKDINKIALKQIKHLGLREITKLTLSFFHLSQINDYIKADDKIFHGAPVVIFLTGPKDDEWLGIDIGACAQNIMLAASSIGLASCPVGFGKYVMQTAHYHLLGVPANELVCLALVIGYGDEQPKMHDRATQNIIYI